MASKNPCSFLLSMVAQWPCSNWGCLAFRSFSVNGRTENLLVRWHLNSSRSSVSHKLNAKLLPSKYQAFNREHKNYNNFTFGVTVLKNIQVFRSAPYSASLHLLLLSLAIVAKYHPICQFALEVKLDALAVKSRSMPLKNVVFALLFPLTSTLRRRHVPNDSGVSIVPPETTNSKYAETVCYAKRRCFHCLIFNRYADG